MLRKGQTVMIYEDPITRDFTEGRARLISLVSVTADLECWRVRFHDDGPGAGTYLRKIGVDIVSEDQD